MIKDIQEYDFPADLKSMSEHELELLSVQIRDFLIESVAKTGGHLSPNLGVVELTVALHKYFDSPKDKIIWDVGHQSYVHKILTGRVPYFGTLRQYGGLSGYPKTAESPHDIFNTGHTSTSVSLMAGLARARDLKGEDFRTVAVIGDGALSGGLAYEALNNLGNSGTKCLVILNDNEMSIGKNELALDNHLSKLRVSKGYYTFKRGLKKALDSIPVAGGVLREGMTTIRDSLKYALLDQAMFEQIGLTYLGPCDGHDIHQLLEFLAMADSIDGPVLLHVITKKGKGYLPAANDPTTYHGLAPFDPTTGRPLKKSENKSFSKVFGEAMEELAEENDKLIAVSAAMLDGTGLCGFSQKYPERTFDVGIAEAYAVSFAAGLAKEGMRPVVAVYSTFLQRAYDQLIIDVCLNDLPVVFAIDRAGNVGEDGETHHGIFDISYLYPVPNLIMLAPRDGAELKTMLAWALKQDHPVAIRYPKTSAKDLDAPLLPMEEGAQVLSEGKDCEIWAVGNLLGRAMEIAENLRAKGYDVGVVSPRILKPVDQEAVLDSAARTKVLFTMEDNVLTGGFGEKMAAWLRDEDVVVKSICWPDSFIPQGSVDELFERYGFGVPELTERMLGFLEETIGHTAD